MKKISLLVASVLMSAFVFAKKSDKPKTSGSSVVVSNSLGSTLFKLRYSSEKVQKHVKVTLFDENGNSIYSETINKTSAFVRPYNFKDMPQGKYAVEVEDENGKALEKINFISTKIEKSVRFCKVPGETNKYVVMISSLQKDNVTINIFDKEDTLLYSEKAEVNGGFGKVYTLNEIKNFSIEVSDSNGLIKSGKF